MKITRRTRSTSINGVMLMSPLVARVFLLPFIWALLLLYLFVKFFRQQADSVDSGCPNGIDDLHDVAVLGAKIRLDVNRFVARPILQKIVDFGGQIVDHDTFLSKVKLPIPGNSNPN